MAHLDRDPSALASDIHDVTVIGGGIHGAALAWDAALRGFKTVLLEMRDFGWASSSGCFKIVHGGLRYLQHADVARLKESVVEQRILRRIAPHLVHPLPFLIPTYGRGMKSRSVLAAGLTVYELIAGFRNAGVSDYHRLPNHRLISPEECLALAPGLNPRGLTGGAMYYDCQMSNCERLTFSVIAAAAAAGARVCNYLEAVGFDVRDLPGGSSWIDSITVCDKLSSARYSLKGRLIINAAGPWVNTVAGFLCRAGQRPVLTKPVFSKGIQVVTDCFINNCAVAVESSYRDPEAKVSLGSRSFFIHPWRGCSLIGTTDTLFEGSPDNFSISAEDISDFLRDVRHAYSSTMLAPEKVRFAFGGLRPLAPGYQLIDGAGGEIKVARKDKVIDHSKAPLDGTLPRIENLLSVIGVKYTTFRGLAEKVVDTASLKLCGRVVPCATAVTTLPGGEEKNFPRLVGELTERFPAFSVNVIRHLASEYGIGADEVLQLAVKQPDLAAVIGESGEILAAEIVYAARNEMVCTLSDIVFRRTGLGSVGSPGEAALKQAARIAAEELGWDKSREQEELGRVSREFIYL